jgi:dynein heavy chain
MVECDRTEERIMKTWFPKVVHLVNSKEMMQSIRAKKLQHFSNSLCTLISNQVRASPIKNRDIEVTQIGLVFSYLC